MILNSEQQAFIDCDGPYPLVLMAPPGSGKTASLVARVLADQARGIDPSRQCVITYTVASAIEIRSRLGDGIGHVRTLSSLCLQIIKDHGQSLGYDKNVKVITNEEGDRIIKALASSLKVRGNIKERIGTSRTSTKEDVAATMYVRGLRNSNTVDYRTMLHEAFRLIDAKPSIVSCDALYVDEAQDSAEIDLRIYDRIEAGIKVFAGDPDQSIFVFRGACPDAMSQVAETIKFLRINYRSTVTIVHAASKMIRKNENDTAVYQEPRSDAPIGQRISVSKLSSSDAEIAVVLAEAKKDSISGHKVAILLRYNADVNRFKEILLSEGMPEGKTTNANLHAKSAESIQMASDVVQALINETLYPSIESLTSIGMDEIASFYADHGLVGVGSVIGCNNKVINVLKGVAGLGLHDAFQALQEDMERAECDIYIGTAHSSKGREFDSVYCPCADDTCWTSKDIEDMRRLWYVMITRAKSKLSISCSPPKGVKPSQFIIDMGLEIKDI